MSNPAVPGRAPHGSWSGAPAATQAPTPTLSPGAQRMLADQHFYYEVAVGAAATATQGVDPAQVLASLWGISPAELEYANAHYTQVLTRTSADDIRASARFDAARQAAWERHLRVASGAAPPSAAVAFDAVPELAAVEAAAARFDWSGLTAALGAIPRPEDLDFALSYIEEMPLLAESFVSIAPRVPENPLVGTIAARALLAYAWDVRGNWPADELTTAQWTAFTRLASRAEQILTWVLSRHPQYLPARASLLLAPVLRSAFPNPDYHLQQLASATSGHEGWRGPRDENAFRTGGGFRWTHQQAAERYNRVVDIDPGYFPAQLATLQLLLPKWGDVEQYGWDGPVADVIGAMEERGAQFVTHCIGQARPGALTHALPAYLHFQRWLQASWFDEWNGGETKARHGERYFRDSQVQAELVRAVADSVGHHDHVESLHSRQARSLLAWELCRGGRHKDAASIFEALDDRPASYGWIHEDIDRKVEPAHPSSE
ncbi:MAG: hypothetical protein FWD11_05395, partial [Micrococcales bacterium]|nr:hypothetical protein [Micrococcales bacterium]